MIEGLFVGKRSSNLNRILVEAMKDNKGHKRAGASSREGIERGNSRKLKLGEV